MRLSVSPRYRDLAINIALAMVSALVTYALIEVFFLRLFAPMLPIKMWGYMDKRFLPLAQSSKKGTVPRDYIMLVGDSYAQGKGDWLQSADRDRNPEFHSAHIIHRRTGRDVITTGLGGLGSLNGLVTRPLSVFDFFDGTLLFKVPHPRIILVYFYEGNDLDNNIDYIRRNYAPEFDQGKIYDPEYFLEFLRRAVRKKIPARLRFRENLLVAGMVAEMISGRKQDPQDEPAATPDGGINAAVIGGRTVALPDGLQGPSLELTDDESRLALYAFEQSLRYMRDYFSDSAVGIVYIPSVLSSYEIVSPKVSVQTYNGRTPTYPASLVWPRSDTICARIAEIAARNHMPFIDARPVIREAAKSQVIHGPTDWGHFKREGYSALAEAALELLDRMGAGTGTKKRP